MFKIAIITQSLNAPGACALLSAAKTQRCEAKLVLTANLYPAEITGCDIIISRLTNKTYATISEFLDHHATDKQLLSPSAVSIHNGFNKCKAAIVFKKNNIPQPKFVALVNGNTLSDISIPGPWVIKPATGNRGIGVAKADSIQGLKAISAEYSKSYGDHIVQEYIESAGTDKRLFVIGNTVVAAMVRTAADGDFRSNLSIGGSAQAYQPSEAEIRIAVSACNSLGLDYAGVDLIGTENNPMILEVNPSPGMKVGEYTKTPIADLIIEHLIKKYENEHA